MTKPARAAYDRKNSMWHEDSAATKASSGSTASSLDKGSGTTFGELEAGTTVPPSKRHSWARVYLLSLKAAPAGRSHTTVARYALMMFSSGFARHGSTYGEKTVGGAFYAEGRVAGPALVFSWN